MKLPITLVGGVMDTFWVAAQFSVIQPALIHRHGLAGAICHVWSNVTLLSWQWLIFSVVSSECKLGHLYSLSWNF